LMQPNPGKKLKEGPVVLALEERIPIWGDQKWKSESEMYRATPLVYS